MKIVPLSPEGASRRTVELGENTVTLVTRWLSLGQCWSLDLYDVAGTALIHGLKLLPGFDLLAPHPDLRRRLGSFYVLEHVAGAARSRPLLGQEAQLVWLALGETL